jgi:hypothetical protein
MPTNLPLAEATGLEVVVRTTYQIIRWDYDLNPEQYDRPATRLFELAYQWRNSGLYIIADCLQDAAHAVSQGTTIASWRSLHLAVDSARLLALSRLGTKPRR